MIVECEEKVICLILDNVFDQDADTNDNGDKCNCWCSSVSLVVF